MKRKQVYFSLFVIVSTVLLIYSVVDRYNKDLPKELAEFSWQLSMLLDYPSLLCFFGFLPLVLFISERKFWMKRWCHEHEAVFYLGILLFLCLFWFSFDSCMNEKLVFSWNQVLYIGLVFLLHFGFCYFLWIACFSD